LSNRAKLKNTVVAFRAVDVMDIVNAPKFFVMAAEQELPKNPMVENRVMTIPTMIMFSLPREDSFHHRYQVD
jgi:hypothetical protein